MDWVAVSPDMDARVCYAAVLVCGLVSALLQVKKRLNQSNITGIWLEPSAWVMYLLYLAIPLALFWLMDRLGALRDTSLFAALLVGVAYPAVLTSGAGGLRAPDTFSSLSAPIERFTDTVVRRLVRTSARQDRRFEQFLVRKMVHQPRHFDEVHKIVRDNVSDTAELARELAAVDAAAAGKGPDDVAAAELKARTLYHYAATIPDLGSMLRTRGVINWWQSLIVPANRSKFLGTALGVLLLCALLRGAMMFLSNERVQANYLIWRLEKPNNTVRDRYRAREALARTLRLGADEARRREILRATAAASGAAVQETEEQREAREESEARERNARWVADYVYDRLGFSLRSPDLPVERADLIVQLLLSSRDASPEANDRLWQVLMSGLRADNIDTRARVQRALTFLASHEDGNEKFAETVKIAKWNPTEGDSIADLEQVYNAWQAVYEERRSGARPADAARPTSNPAPAEQSASAVQPPSGNKPNDAAPPKPAGSN